MCHLNYSRKLSKINLDKNEAKKKRLEYKNKCLQNFHVMVLQRLNLIQGGQYLRLNIAEFSNMSEIFWIKKFPVYPSTKGVPNIAEFANMSEIFGEKNFRQYWAPCIFI